jgi:RNA polymerase sigma factor (sigma-70 family)
MSSIVWLNSKAIGSQERASRQPEDCVEDCEGSFEELIAPLESRMIRSIWRVVRNPALAEDTLQDALTTIWRKRRQVRRHPNPQALMLKICLHAAYDSLRKHRRFLRHVEISILGDAPGPTALGAASALAAKEMEREVIEAIAQLPRKQALAVMMRVMQEEPFDVIARTLGCTEVTARIHVSKGRARLRLRLAHLIPSVRKEAANEYGQKV